MVYNRQQSLKRATSLLTAIAALSILAIFSFGLPIGPDSITNVTSSRLSDPGTKALIAQAGNVSEITIVAQPATNAWQGYYGNISGTITLENSGGDVFYNWVANEPTGEIFASHNSSITWSAIQCFAFVSGTEPNRTTEELRYGMNATDLDGIDETFNETSHDGFFVGSVSISANTCPSTNVYTNSQRQTATDNWQNVLLLDTTGNSLIFTTIIETRQLGNQSDKRGYDNSFMDFQLLVAEDGHGPAEATKTTYYFFVEIE